MKLAGMLLLFVAMSGLALAPTQAPEIDLGSAGTAIALLSGTLLIFRSRRTK
jgi:hypothetical protein